MKYVLVCAYDALLKAFMPLQTIAQMEDEDIRESHRRAVIGKQIEASRAENLVIFKMGSFNDANGEIVILDKPVEICKLADFLSKGVSNTKEELANVPERN